MSDSKLTLLPSLHPTTPEPNPHVLERLEALLVQARAGEVTGLLWATVAPDSGVTWGASGEMSAADMALAYRGMGITVDDFIRELWRRE